MPYKDFIPDSSTGPEKYWPERTGPLFAEIERLTKLRDNTKNPEAQASFQAQIAAIQKMIDAIPGKPE